MSEDQAADDGDAEIDEVKADPFEQVHQALYQAWQRNEIEDEWYLTDFLVIGVAQSFNPERKGTSLCFQLGPEVDPPPHRVLGLLEYALTRYKHGVQCCLHDCDDDDGED